jgi:Family of unknown function (DUF5670)
MNKALYTVAIILVILWAIGFFAYNAGAFIHLLLVVAVISVLMKVIQTGADAV